MEVKRLILMLTDGLTPETDEDVNDRPRHYVAGK